jgi:hypothetical protein
MPAQFQVLKRVVETGAVTVDVANRVAGFTGQSVMKCHF